MDAARALLELIGGRERQPVERRAEVVSTDGPFMRVKVDGCDGFTDCVTWTAECAVGDRVIVRLDPAKHSATVTQNVTNKSVGGEILTQKLEKLGLISNLYVALSSRLSVPTAGGPSVSYAGAADASAQAPRGAELSGSLGVRTSGGPTVGFSASCSFGDAMHAVPSSELAPVPPQVQASGYSWSASSAAVVETVELGGDLGVSGVESVTAAVSGEVAFSASFDGGATWLAWDGSGWAPGTMGADQMSAAAGWPSAPLRVRMEMAGGSSVNGLTVWFERSM